MSLIKALLSIGLVLSVFCSGAVADGYKYAGTDDAAALAIRYTPSTAGLTATYQVSTTNLIFAGTDSVVNGTITFGTNWITHLIDDVRSVTNLSDYHPFTVVKWAALDADITSNKFTVVAATALTPNSWDNRICIWDTSEVLHYDLVPNRTDRWDGSVNSLWIQRLLGEPDGTGDLSINIYDKDDVAVYTKTYYSPNSWVSATAGTYSTNAVFYINEELEIKTKTGNGPGQGRALIRMTRGDTVGAAGFTAIIK